MHLRPFAKGQRWPEPNDPELGEDQATLMGICANHAGRMMSWEAVKHPNIRANEESDFTGGNYEEDWEPEPGTAPELYNDTLEGNGNWDLNGPQRLRNRRQIWRPSRTEPKDAHAPGTAKSPNI